MVDFPHAKINIGLNILEKRSDGFHNIESVFYPIEMCDVLEVIEDREWKKKEEKIKFTNSGITIPGKAEENLCYKTYQLISKDYSLPPIKAHLHKIIPVGAGLGGGSADAAFFIKLLNKKFEIGLAWGEMHHYAKQLGSDCSFFISGKPAFVKGKGDDFESIQLDLNAYWIALVYPNIHISTAEAYAKTKPEKPAKSIEELIKLPIEEWKNNIYNDFEISIFPAHPEIKKIKEKMYSLGAIYASMSGSGSSVYGVFNSLIDLKKEFQQFFVWQSNTSTL